MMALPHLSQYKNLVHRYYHSRGKGAASTFWAGCGAVVGVGERVRALLALGSVAALLVWATGFIPTWLLVATVAASALANLELIRFFNAQRGALFAARAFLYHQFYYVYSSAAFVYASLRHVVSGLRAGAAAWRHPTKNRGTKG